MNNKGQSLVVFIALLPLFLLVLTLVVNTGFAYTQKRSAENNVKETLELIKATELTDEQIKSEALALLDENIENLNTKNVNVSTDYIEIEITINIKMPFKGIFTKYYDNVKIHYAANNVLGNLKIIKK